MARQVKPEIPNATNAPQYKVNQADWSEFEKLGDAQIKAANENYKLYAQALLNSESAKAYGQFKNDPINLSNALAKLPEMISDLPDEVQTEINKKFYLNSISLVQRAEKNRVAENDLQNKENSAYIINTSKEELVPAYMNVLQNNNAPADEKQPVVNDIYLQHVDNLDRLSELKNSSGKDVYSATQKKAIKNIADAQLEGFKQYVDGMILNDNDDLETTKKYYQEQVLAPERFMTENYMDRQAYEKARAYLEKQMKQAGADIRKMRFKQSVRDFVDLQISDAPSKLEELKESGLLNKEMIKKMEKVNVKFNEVDPSKTESPIAMINTLEMLRNFQFNKVPTTEAEQEEILRTGVDALDSLADYCQQNGISQKTCDIARKNVVLAETDAAFAPILNNFNDIIDNFTEKMSKVRERSAGVSGKAMVYNTNWNGLDNEEEILLKQLNDILAVSLVNMHNMIRQGDYEGLRKEQRKVQIQAAQLKYDWVENLEQAIENKDTVIEKNGFFVRPRAIMPNGTCIFENCD